MRIVVTGGAGYLGSRLAGRLLDLGHEVVVLDSLPHGGASLLHLAHLPGFRLVRGDVRDKAAVQAALEGAEAVVHLAAAVIVTGRETPEQIARIEEVNHVATGDFVAAARSAGASRFLFASTCSNYGYTGSDAPVTETSPLEPTSPYSRSKVAAERLVLGAASPSFHPTVLRFATLFGASPGLHFDSLLHQLVRDAFADRRLKVFAPSAWRPFLHVADAARAVEAVLGAPARGTGGEVFNVGGDALNVRKGDAARLVQARLPGAQLELVPETSDPRSYRVSFEKIRERLGFVPGTTLAQGIDEVARVLEWGLAPVARNQGA